MVRGDGTCDAAGGPVENLLDPARLDRSVAPIIVRQLRATVACDSCVAPMHTPCPSSHASRISLALFPPPSPVPPPTSHLPPSPLPSPLFFSVSWLRAHSRPRLHYRLLTLCPGHRVSVTCQMRYMSPSFPSIEARPCQASPEPPVWSLIRVSSLTCARSWTHVRCSVSINSALRERCRWSTGRTVRCLLL